MLNSCRARSHGTASLQAKGGVSPLEAASEMGNPIEEKEEDPS